MVSCDARRTPLGSVCDSVAGTDEGTDAGTMWSTPSSGVSMGVVTALPLFRKENRPLGATAGTACEVDEVDRDLASRPSCFSSWRSIMAT